MWALDDLPAMPSPLFSARMPPAGAYSWAVSGVGDGLVSFAFLA